MKKFNKSQALMLSLFAALLIITPLLSSSLRRTYLYFIINLLIIALGAEAGLLSFVFSKPPEDKKHSDSVSQPGEASIDQPKTGPATAEKKATVKTVEKSASEKITGSTVKVADRVKKCSSMPSIFFIGGGETDQVVDDVAEESYEEIEEEEVGGLNGQELFTKAETFIGNFYKQLKMQREDSWKRIHGLYHKAF